MNNSIHPPFAGLRRSAHQGCALAGLLACGLAWTSPQSFGAVVQEAYVKAYHSGTNDQFGTSVAILGDTMVVGAPTEAGNGTGPWRTVTNAVNPCLVITTNLPQQFFRLRLP